MSSNIVQNRFRQQVTGAVAGLEEIADEGGGDGQGRHVEGHYAPGRGAGEPGRVLAETPPAGGLQGRRQGPRPVPAMGGEAWTVGHGDVGQVEQGLPAMPARQAFEGVGAEDENGPRGAIRHKGDFAAQCNYAYDKIKRALAANGSSPKDAVKMTVYVTDMRYRLDWAKCSQENFAGERVPAQTLLGISQLAFPEMIIEIDVTAVAHQ